MGAKTKREGTFVYLWLIHVVVCQKPTQHYKAIILQLKIIFNEKKKKEKQILIVMPVLKWRLWKESEPSFQAAKYKSHSSFSYIKHSQQFLEEIYIKQWNGDMGDERKCVWHDTQAKYEIIQDSFLRNQKEKEREIKSLKQNALVPTLKCKLL